MRIHSNTLTRDDLLDAAHAARVWLAVLSNHGSRKRARAYEVQLSGSSSYRAQGHDDYAATWDEWGNFLAALYDRDRDMIAGPYKSRDDFTAQTREAVKRTREYEAIVGRKRPDVTGPWLTKAGA